MYTFKKQLFELRNLCKKMFKEHLFASYFYLFLFTTHVFYSAE